MKLTPLQTTVTQQTRNFKIQLLRDPAKIYGFHVTDSGDVRKPFTPSHSQTLAGYIHLQKGHGVMRHSVFHDPGMLQSPKTSCHCNVRQSFC